MSIKGTPSGPDRPGDVLTTDLAAGEWAALARHAAVVLTADRDQPANMSDRIRLLADCRTAFEDADALPSTSLGARPRFDPEAPGCEPAPGITPKRLASLPTDYDIRSVYDIWSVNRFPEPIGQVRSYSWADFTDSWAHYCPPSAGCPSQASSPNSGPGRIETWDGWIRPTKTPVPRLNSDWTAGTDVPRLGVINGGGAA